LPLHDFPEDNLCLVFSFLDAESLCSVRRVSFVLQQVVDRNSSPLWGALCLHDFRVKIAYLQSLSLCAHQEYTKNVMMRAADERRNLLATKFVRESLEAYSSRFGGVLGLVSDLGYIEDPRIARAVSQKRRAAMSTAIVKSTSVMYDFRRRGMFSGPLNFLPIDTLLDHADPHMPPHHSLPPLPGGPHPGFLGYAVELVRLRPEHECLRMTALYAVLKDLAVFETEVDAESCRQRCGRGERFFCCALDFPPDQADQQGQPTPHIGHWGFRPLFEGAVCRKGPGIGGAGKQEIGRSTRSPGVEQSLAQLEARVQQARSSLAYIQYGGGVSHRL
ncbi:unnamed protein product, partial [Discosporangium mesarthrocarpum]